MEIRYQGRWSAVRQRGWTDANSNAVCSLLSCGGGTAGPQQFHSGSFLPNEVRCPPKPGHIAECVTRRYQVPVQDAVTLICEGGCVLCVSVHQSVQQRCLWLIF